MSIYKERRIKAVSLGWRQIERLAMVDKPGSFICLPSLPEGACLVGIHNSPQSHDFTASFWHESFPIVPDGEIPPTHGVLRFDEHNAKGEGGNNVSS
jgi:hypothetical protein